ncbi:putative Ca2+/H+ antiporter (TMEM165/GDT1 family) [Anaerosolibacter carboniphilus]|uniref:GDT1 family protein n=1 Tax=Anaerosolibacter carboniphilus TaxID=1417629 RepID=A0A841KYN9_9FIRM|nr:TMEM165/GDT1 family protein [Anaerosolibacter carboniphilus]MBB6218744.1 putative Ca2+/H+ antiporter (TMEM165/GDT1 family) [Anaerosolibacter carboniphilus]
MIQEFIRSLFLIFMAEMGDKTQILAMAFATQYRVKKVLLGVLLGSLLNHGIAVALGSYLSNIIPINTIQIIAGVSFVGFALWTLKNDKEDDEEENNKSRFGPVFTVAMAFFIGELGDKTQLTAITLSVDAVYPIFVLMGTVSGMILTSGLGIYVGSKIGDRIPEFTIKIVSAAIFMFFGVTKLYTTLPPIYIQPIYIGGFFVVIGISVYLLLKPAIDARRRGELSPFREAALTLYEYTHQIKEAVDEICLGEGQCGKCQGSSCIIGYTKALIRQVIESGEFEKIGEWQGFPESLEKNFEEGKVVESLSITLTALTQHLSQEEMLFIHKVRQALEMVLFGEKIPFNGDLGVYFEGLKMRGTKTAQKVIQRVEELRSA